MKYVNVVLCKSVDVVWLGSNARDRSGVLNVLLILNDEKYPVCITSTPKAYATIDTKLIHHVYKTDFAVCVPISTTGSWDLFAIKSAAVFGLVFF